MLGKEETDPHLRAEVNKGSRTSALLLKGVGGLLKMMLLMTAPFIVLIRSAVLMHVEYGFHPWAAILAGALLAIGLLLIYVTWISSRFSGRMAFRRGQKWKLIIVGIVVATYCGHSILALSESHMKDLSVRKEYGQLHPILRLALGTIVFIDERLVVTDATRQVEDYKRMGLKTIRKSLHFIQEDGYAHAVDIRTSKPFSLRDFLIAVYFKSMGFDASRHEGTSDHLHISI